MPVKRRQASANESPNKKRRTSKSNDESKSDGSNADEALKNQLEEQSVQVQSLQPRPLTKKGDSKSGNYLSKYLVEEIKGGEVYYIQDFVSEETATQWLADLLSIMPWYHPKLKVYGKEVSQSRSIAAYATNKDITVKYSGHLVDMHYEYPALLSEIQNKVEDFLGEAFNHVMLNRYESGKEYIGKHRDTKENKIIVSLTLGARRTFIMTPDKSNPSAKPHRWVLDNGSLLIMQGKTQDCWKHEIPREPKITEERLSLTFRQLHAPPS